MSGKNKKYFLCFAVKYFQWGFFHACDIIRHEIERGGRGNI